MIGQPLRACRGISFAIAGPRSPAKPLRKRIAEQRVQRADSHARYTATQRAVSETFGHQRLIHAHGALPGSISFKNIKPLNWNVLHALRRCGLGPASTWRTIMRMDDQGESENVEERPRDPADLDPFTE